MELDKRKHKILEAIVKTYIETGEPVGSKYLAQSTDWGLSSATIRNEMAALSEFGYIEQPYTSAGRAPSEKGYRFYIQYLMPRHNLTPRERSAIDIMVRESVIDLSRLLESTSEALAQLTLCASVSVTSYREGARVLRIELIALSRRAMVVVAVSSTGAVKNRQCVTDADVSADMLAFLNRFMDIKLAGRLVGEITDAFVRELLLELPPPCRPLGPIVEFACLVCVEPDEGEIHLKGQDNLLHYKELVDHAAELLTMFGNSQRLLEAIAAPGEGIGVTIGDEQGRAPLTQMSRIVSDVPLGAHRRGRIAIFGPTRIRYAKVIASLEYYTRTLHRMLSELEDAD